MIAIAGRFIGPGATLALLAYLSIYPPKYTATYAVLAAYLQFATAPLNPYAEHYQLREIMSGRKGGLAAGLYGLGLIWIVSAALVIGLEQSPWLLSVIPVLGLGHLLIKIVAARLRSCHQNGLAINLEYTLRPMVLLILAVLLLTLAGPSEAALTWAFGLTGFVTIAVALAMWGTAPHPFVDTATDAPPSARSAPWGFVLLGMLMVLTSQFEVFAMIRLADSSALSTYKVALQLASICGIATNFVLTNNLRALYAHSSKSAAYRGIFRKVQLQTLFLSITFMMGFAVIGFVQPLLWPPDIWLLASAAASIFAVSAAYGPLANWFYSTGGIRLLALSLALMLAVKLLCVAGLALVGLIGPISLLVVYGLGVLTQNQFLLMSKSRLSA